MSFNSESGVTKIDTKKPSRQHLFGQAPGATDVLATPQDFFDRVNKVFKFNLDVCALPENAKCERLQGFPDNWTQIPYRKKPADQCPDGPRYAACGNSMAVPVMRWIGQRIQDHIDGKL